MTAHSVHACSPAGSSVMPANWSQADIDEDKMECLFFRSLSDWASESQRIAKIFASN